MLVSVTCLVCPLVECFDRWDHTPQTGNDTEFVFMILALCLGAACLLAHLMGSLWLAYRHRDSGVCSEPVSPARRRFTFFPPIGITISPPSAALRI